MNKRLFILMASLLLCGAASAQNHWGDDPDSHAQPSNTPIVATVQINGNTVAATPTSDYRLGAFIDGNLWGIAAPHTDGKFWIQVFYETTGEEISFKLYDGQNEYTTCTVVEPTTMTAVTTSEAGAVVTLNFTNGQTVELAAGNNWWSTNLDITLDNLKNALVTAMPEGNSIRITAQNGSFIIYNGTNWIGNITALDITKFYIVKTTESCEMTLTGLPINPAQHPITILPNNNWIAFPLSEPTTVSNAFSGYTATNNDRVTAQDGKYVIYLNGNWIGNLTTLQPGKGYIYSSKATGNKTLIFQPTTE